MMGSSDKRANIWVHPDFHKKLKVESSIHGISMIKYTERLANDKPLIINPHKDKKKKDKGFEFGF